MCLFTIRKVDQHISNLCLSRNSSQHDIQCTLEKTHRAHKFWQILIEHPTPSIIPFIFFELRMMHMLMSLWDARPHHNQTHTAKHTADIAETTHRHTIQHTHAYTAQHNTA